VRPHRLACAALVAAWVLGASRAHAAPPTKAQCIAANEDAQDLEHSGKLREARSKLAVCVATACPGVLREDCGQRLADVEKRIPSIVLVAKDGEGNDLTGVRLSIDGVSVSDSLDGTAITLDPGEHRFTFESEGLPPLTKKLVLREGDKGRREVVVLRAHPGAATSAVAARAALHDDEPAPAPTEGAASHETTPSSAGDGQRTAGWVLGGAGLVGLGVGAVLGFVSKSTYDHALQTECNGDPKTCSPQGSRDGSTAHAQAMGSTVAFVAGGVAFATGSLLVLTAPKSGVSVGVTAAPGVAQIGVGKSW
jgi:hypothetical protein